MIVCAYKRAAEKLVTESLSRSQELNERFKTLDGGLPVPIETEGAKKIYQLLASYYLSDTNNEDSPEAFERYIKKFQEVKLSRDEYNMYMESLTPLLKQNLGLLQSEELPANIEEAFNVPMIIKLDTEEGKELYKDIENNPSLFHTFRNNSKEGKGEVVVFLAKPVLDDNRTKTRQQLAVEKLQQLSKMWRKKKEDVPNPDDETLWSGETKYEYNGNTITAKTVSTEIYPDPNAPLDRDERNKKIKAKQDNYPVLSSLTGKLFDAFGRDFFNPKSLQNKVDLEDKEAVAELCAKVYKNFITPADFINLRKDFEKLQELIHEKFGKNCVVISDDINLFALKEVTDEGLNKYITGNPDLLIVDEDGVVHVLDFKAKKGGVANGMSFEENVRTSEEGYAKQLTRYVKMLEAYGFTVSPKIHLILGEAHVTSLKGSENEKNKKFGQHYFEVEDTYGLPTTLYYDGTTDANGNKVGISLAELQEKDPSMYSAPRIHFAESSKDIPAIYQIEFDSEGIPSYIIDRNLALEDVAEFYKAMGVSPRVKAVQRQYQHGITTLDEGDIFSRPDYISSEELHFLAEALAIEIIRQIDSYKEDHGCSTARALEIEGMESFIQEALNRRLRYTDLSTPEKEARLIRRIVNKGLGQEYAEQAIKIAKKKNWLRQGDRPRQLLELGYTKLLSLDSSLTLTKSDANLDLGDNAVLEDVVTKMVDGAVDKEAWMASAKQISPMSSLATELRQLFGIVYEIDANGELVLDPYGYEIPVFVSPTKVVESILSFFHKYETLEEILDKMKEMSNYKEYYYYKSILEKLDKDSNLRTKFFRHFRKDMTQYSQIKVKWKDGKQIYIHEIVNTRPAAEAMMMQLENAFKNRTVSDLIYSHDGSVNEAAFDKFKASLSNLKYQVKKLYDNAKEVKNERRKEFLLDNLDSDKYNVTTFGFLKTPEVQGIVPAVNKVLTEIGFHLTDDVVESAIRDRIVGSKTSNLARIIHHIEGIESSFIGAKDYRGGKGINLLGSQRRGIAGSGNGVSAYEDYAALVTLFAPYVQQHVESSVYLDGKTYYSYSNPSQLLSIVRNLKNAAEDEVKFENYIKDNFTRYKGVYTDMDGDLLVDWIKQLKFDPELRNLFNHKVELNFTGTEYKELKGVGYQLSLLAHYHANSLTKTNYHRERSIESKVAGTFRWFAVPTLSNKPSSEFIYMRAYENKKEIVNKVLHNTYLMETYRMVDVLQHYIKGEAPTENMDITDDVLESAGFSKEERKTLKEHIYEGKVTFEELGKLSKSNSGAKFHFLYYLNNALQQSENREVADYLLETINEYLNPKPKVKKQQSQEEMAEEFKLEMSKVHKLFTLLESEFTNQIEAELQNMRDIGLFATEEVNVNGKKVTRLKYQGRFQGALGSTNENNLERAIKSMEDSLREYIMQDIAANINMIQIMAGDIAYYGNSVNFQKRFAQVHSPGIHLSSEKDLPDGIDDGYIRSLHIADKVLPSTMIETAEQALRKRMEQLPPSERGDFEKMIKVIVGGLQKVNFTDGQSFSSPSGYRKKLKNQGLWTKAMSAAFIKIQAGNFNLNDLNVVWNASKPFVTAHLPKYSGSNTIAFRRKPIQDKNSEYMLLLAGALAAQPGTHSKFTALYDFMESTHWSSYDFDRHCPNPGAIYEKNGIDTVHFASVGKVGLTKVVDINDLNTDEEVIEALNEAIEVLENLDNEPVYQKFNERSATPIDTTYDDQVVDAVPIENYIIQQEVPTHFLNHEQLYGSQIKILGISDITPGTQFNVRGEMINDQDLIDEYQKLQAQKIYDSYEALKREFGIDTSKDSFNDVAYHNERIQKLHDMLHKKILSDPQWGYDLIQAVELEVVDDSGRLDFKVPLTDPMHGSRIQMLINSIIKNNINKQKINGGPLVQTTVYDKDLKIVWEEDAQGNKVRIKYFECYAPVPDARLERMMTSVMGTIMSFEELKKHMPADVFEDMTTMIGYRIPTEDKYSMIPLKIVGFLPKAAGETIMMPAEITEITGSDFDIDKLYIMKRSFNFKTNYQDALTEAELDEIIKNAMRDNKGKELTEEMLKKAKHRYKRNRMYRGFSRYTNTEADSWLERKEAINNRLIDLQWAVLTSEDTLPKMLNPGGFESIKVVDRKINIIKNKVINPSTNQAYTWDELESMSSKDMDKILNSVAEHSVTLPSSKIYFQQQNMQGTQMTGIFANQNVSHAICSLQNIGIDLGDKNFSMFGVEIGGRMTNKLDPIKSFSGRYVSRNIADYLTASLDTAKDPSLRGLNVSTFTGGVASLLTRLGFSIEEVGLFLAQPIIEKVSDAYYRGALDSYYTGESAIAEIWNALGDNMDKKELYNTKMLQNGVISVENLVEGLTTTIKTNINGKLEMDDIEDFQKRILIAFNILYSMSKDLNDLTFCTKINSMNSAVGPLIADTEAMNSRIDNFIDRVIDGKTCFYVPKNDMDEFTHPAEIIENDPMLEAFFNTVFNEETGISKLIFEPYFANYLPGFLKVLRGFQDSYAKMDKINAKIYNTLLNDYVYYCLTLDRSDKGISATIPSSKKELDHFIKGVTKRFEQVCKKEGRKPNLILDQGLENNCLRVRKADEFLPIDTLIFYAEQLNSYEIERIKVAWSELVTSEDPEIRSLGIDLFYYTLMKNGFCYSTRTMMHMASVIVRQNARVEEKIGEEYKTYTTYIQGLRNIRRIDEIMLDDNLVVDFLDAFFRNHSNNLSLVPNVKLSESQHLKIIKDVDGGTNIFIVEIPNSDTACINKFMLKNNTRERVPKRFVSVSDNGSFELYQIDKNMIGCDDVRVDYNGMVTLKYRRVNRLGLPNNFIELDANDNRRISYFQELREIMEYALKRYIKDEEEYWY